MLRDTEISEGVFSNKIFLIVLQEIWPEKETVKIFASTVHKIKRTQSCKVLLLTDIVVQREQTEKDNRAEEEKLLTS